MYKFGSWLHIANDGRDFNMGRPQKRLSSDTFAHCKSRVQANFWMATAGI
jgi:hypothetical protein